MNPNAYYLVQLVTLTQALKAHAILMKAVKDLRKLWSRKMNYCSTLRNILVIKTKLERNNTSMKDRKFEVGNTPLACSADHVILKQTKTL